jgi:hypothetical protein
MAVFAAAVFERSSDAARFACDAPGIAVALLAGAVFAAFFAGGLAAGDFFAAACLVAAAFDCFGAADFVAFFAAPLATAVFFAAGFLAAAFFAGAFFAAFAGAAFRAALFVDFFAVELLAAFFADVLRDAISTLRCCGSVYRPAAGRRSCMSARRRSNWAARPSSPSSVAARARNSRLAGT